MDKRNTAGDHHRKVQKQTEVHHVGFTTNLTFSETNISRLKMDGWKIGRLTIFLLGYTAFFVRVARLLVTGEGNWLADLLKNQRPNRQPHEKSIVHIVV